MSTITPGELKVISTYVNDLTGIVLDNTKAYLIESRFGPILKELNCNNYTELYMRAKNDPTKQVANRIIDAITTNETYFFRDKSPFNLLQYRLLPDYIDRMNKNPGARPGIKILCAACSTGQEVYSVAIVLKEMIPDLHRWSVTLMGVDISDSVLKQASYGLYNKTEVERGLSPELLRKYFTPAGNQWKIKDEIRSMTTFRYQNLLQPNSGFLKYDIVFCRNVAIYFSQQNRAILFNRLAEQMNPHGVLIIGSTESLFNVTNRYLRKEYMNTVFYELNS